MSSPICPTADRPTADAFINSYFGSNYTVDLQHECCAQDINLNVVCKVHFFPKNNSVRAYGNIIRGQFKANPDIVGLGVSLPHPQISLFLPSTSLSASEYKILAYANGALGHDLALHGPRRNVVSRFIRDAQVRRDLSLEREAPTYF
jgi:hypothetical protein